MARFSGALTQGLMNPTYAGQLSQAAGMLGGLGGDLRKQRLTEERASALQAQDDPRKRLQLALQQAKTSAEVLQIQQAISQLDLQAAQESRAQAAEARAVQQAAYVTEDRNTAAAKAKDIKAQEFATAQISAMAQRRDALRATGKNEAADKIQSDMADIAGGARIDLTPWAEDVDKTTGASRYLNIGGGKVFDVQEGAFITDPTEEQLSGPVLDPKDYLSNIRQEQKDEARWKPEAYQDFLTDIQKHGVYGSAEKHLTKENQVDLARAEADMVASAVTDAVVNVQAIDDLLAIAPDGGFADATAQALFDWIPASEEKSVAKAVETLEANIAFDRLQKMRDQSKTGGALGQVSEKELALLKANLANLDPTSRDFKKNLEKIKASYQRTIDIEQGPEGGSPNYRTAPDGTVYYKDPRSGLVYDYSTGKVIPR